MLKHRVIPCVLLKDWQLVKSIGFTDYRTIGHPTSTARIYNARNVDELIVLDIDASLNGEEINSEIITDIADECFMPLTVGGGIRSIDDIHSVLHAGADKIAINSIALADPTFITEAAACFGSQCIVCSIDVKKVSETINGIAHSRYHVFSKKDGILDQDPLSLARSYQAHGAGEILLTSVDHEGSTAGYDLDLLDMFNQQLNIPIIANGGMGTPQHAVEAIQHGADALAAAYIFHFSRHTPDDIKRALLAAGISARL